MSLISDFLQHYRVPMDLSGRGKNRPGWINVRCIGCGRYPYLGINEQRLYATAWCCGYFPLARVLQELTGASAEAVRLLIGEAPVSFVPKSKQTGTLKPPAGLEDELPTPQRAYLRSRGFNPDELVKLWGLRGTSAISSRIAPWSVYIPVHQNGVVTSWTSRRITNHEPRYVSARDNESAVPISELLYGADYVHHAAILCEGPADVWRIGPGSVALLGLRVSPGQLARLAQYPIRVIAFDNEEPAQVRARKLMRELAPLGGKTVNVTLNSAKDAGEAPRHEIAELRRRFL